MADMYNYWCPYCGQGYSVGKFDLQSFQCPKPDCKLRAKGIMGSEVNGKAVVVPKIGKTIPESSFTFKDMRFSEIGTKKIVTADDDINDGVEKIDERKDDTGKSAATTGRGRRKNVTRKNKGNQ